MNQPQLNFATATDARDDALARVRNNADPNWWNTCYNIVINTATTTNTFTSDDIWQALTDAQLPTPREPRALGSVLAAAHRAGIITPTDSYRQSRRTECHARPIRVWRAA
jgi:hypothetical protein